MQIAPAGEFPILYCTISTIKIGGLYNEIYHSSQGEASRAEQTCNLSDPLQPAVVQNVPWLAQNYGCDNKFWVLIAVFCEF